MITSEEQRIVLNSIVDDVECKSAIACDADLKVKYYSMREEDRFLRLRESCQHGILRELLSSVQDRKKEVLSTVNKKKFRVPDWLQPWKYLYPPQVLHHTANPTRTPTTSPTSVPSRSPTMFPTISPTFAPTSSPTKAPTSSPTAFPTASPTFEATKEIQFSYSFGFMDMDDYWDKDVSADHTVLLNLFATDSEEDIFVEMNQNEPSYLDNFQHDTFPANEQADPIDFKKTLPFNEEQELKGPYANKNLTSDPRLTFHHDLHSVPDSQLTSGGNNHKTFNSDEKTDGNLLSVTSSPDKVASQAMTDARQDDSPGHEIVQFETSSIKFGTTNFKYYSVSAFILLVVVAIIHKQIGSISRRHYSEILELSP
jgi:hypothetical protein